MNWMMWVCLFCSIGFAIGTVIAFLCASRPLSYFWTQFTNPAGGSYAYDLYRFYLGNAAANVCIDVLILLVPIPIVWGLQLQMIRKILVCGIFLLGVLYELHISFRWLSYLGFCALTVMPFYLVPP